MTVDLRKPVLLLVSGVAVAALLGAGPASACGRKHHHKTADNGAQSGQKAAASPASAGPDHVVNARMITVRSATAG